MRTWFALLKRVSVVLVVAGLVLVAAPTALANVRVEGGNVPFYARLAIDEILHTDDWAAVVFYRPPECVPADFNLLDFFDVPGAFDCNPPTTSGFEIWKNGPATESAPILSELHGLGAVPVWFVSWPELEAAIADGFLTIGDLGSMSSLRVGSATFYQETLRPTEEEKLATGEFNARGTLADGRSFQLQATDVWRAGGGSVRYAHTRIVFR